MYMKNYKHIIASVILVITSYLLIVNVESIINENYTYTINYDEYTSDNSKELRESVTILKDNLKVLNETTAINGLSESELKIFKQDMNSSATLLFKNNFIVKRGTQKIKQHDVLTFFEENELDFSITRMSNKYELNSKSENYVSKKASVAVLYSSILSVGNYAYYNYRTSDDFSNREGINGSLFALNIQRAKSNLILRINLLSMIIENYITDGGNVNDTIND